MKDKEILGMMPNTMEVIKEVVLPRLKENTKEVENIAKELISFEKEVNKELDKIVAEISSIVSEHEQLVSSSADKTLSNEKDIQKVKYQLSKLSDSHVNSVAKLEQLISEAEAKIAILSEDDGSEEDTEEKELYDSVEKLKIDLQRTKDEITSKLSSKENEERIIEISDVKGLLEVLQNISMSRGQNTVQTSALNVFNSNLLFYQGVTKINFTGATLTRDGDTINVPVGGSGGGDVVGPASATNGAPALFDGTTGKLLKNSTPTGTGNPVLQTSPTLTEPRFVDNGFIADQNGNEMLAFNSNASAVNYLELENSATTLPPHIRSKGTDTNIGLHLVGKGTGQVSVCDATDETKRMRFSLSNNTTGAVTTLQSNSTSARTIDLPDATDTLVGRATTDTLTNKRITRRVQTVTSSATVTPSFDNDDDVVITAQAAGLTIANPTGTPTDGQVINIRLKDNGTSQTVAFGTSYRAIGVTLPTATTISKTVYIGCRYNSVDAKMDVVALAQEA